MKHEVGPVTPNKAFTPQHFRSARWIATLALTCGALALAGCASIISGTRQNIEVTSVPAAADVKVERLMPTMNSVEFEGKTPTQVKLYRKGSYLVTVSLNGYQKAEIPVSGGGMNGWVWGNLVFGGIIGILIDASNGAATNLKPNEINVTLVACQTSQTGQSAGVYAVVYTGAPDGKTQVHAFPLKPVDPPN